MIIRITPCGWEYADEEDRADVPIFNAPSDDFRDVEVPDSLETEEAINAYLKKIGER